MPAQDQPKPDPQLVILIDKPLEWTSFGVVKKLKYAGKFRKIGHAGTLDPLATGLLILCTGKKTKEIEKYQGQIKEYTGSMILGMTTPSIDLETTPEPGGPTENITQDKVREAFGRFTGSVTQTPPIYSAVKVDGQRAYKAARKGQEITIKSRVVQVDTFELTNLQKTDEGLEASFRVVCSKGTYIRSLVRDVGEQLHCGAYMNSLRRTKIGEFAVEDALSPEEWIEKYTNGHLH